MAPSEEFTRAPALTTRMSYYIVHNFVLVQFWFMKLTSEDANIFIIVVVTFWAQAITIATQHS